MQAIAVKGQARDLEDDLAIATRRKVTKAGGLMSYLLEAIEGWPYAIRRAMEAEAEVDRLRNEIRILQDHLHGEGRPFD